MCGIVGYIGDMNKTKQILLEGLSRLEYRGYDSSGIAVLNDDVTNIVKTKGKIADLRKKTRKEKLKGQLGIGHTRWATHGIASEVNAHPHTSGTTSVVHNGIIENYVELKSQLKDKGFKFSSDTDSEILAHLVESGLQSGKSFEESARQAFKKVKGAYAVAVITEREPEKLIVLRNFSPVILGLGENENYIASDIPAIIPYTNRIVYLEDGDMAIVEKNEVEIKDLNGQVFKRREILVNYSDPAGFEKGGFKHFMLKEIYEQPRSALDTMRGRISGDFKSIELGEIKTKQLNKIKKIITLGCGTSFHSCLIGKILIESFSRIPVEVNIASEFRYSNPIIDEHTMVVVVSQSGETADTSEALLEAKKLGAKTLAITNVFNSKIARQSDHVIYTKAGTEIGVASTKAFTTQLLVFYILSNIFGKARGKLTAEQISSNVKSLISIPLLIERILKLDEQIKVLAQKYNNFNNFIFLGRGLNYPIALEGALKLKEISYIHAEGYAAGEMKHGPIALVDEKVPVLFIAPNSGSNFTKIIGNLREIKARNGLVIFLTTENGANEYKEYIDDLVEIPNCDYNISPIATIIPLQLFAYHIARIKGTDIDQPRNLAKVVTVE
jgi:glucosamine--fructose-6-phosphate aminotransferase (isomerizing)